LTQWTGRRGKPNPKPKPKPNPKPNPKPKTKTKTNTNPPANGPNVILPSAVFYHRH